MLQVGTKPDSELKCVLCMYTSARVGSRIFIADHSAMYCPEYCGRVLPF